MRDKKIAPISRLGTENAKKSIKVGSSCVPNYHLFLVFVGTLKLLAAR